MAEFDADPQHLEERPLSGKDQGLLIALGSWVGLAQFDPNLYVWLCTDKGLSQQCHYLREMDLIKRVRQLALLWDHSY